MKLPSLNYLFEQAKKSIVRFPLVLLFSLVGVSVGIYLSEYESEVTDVIPYINIMLSAGLAIPLLFCVYVFADKQQLDQKKKYLMLAGGIVGVILIYFTFPDSEETANRSLPYVRYAIFNVAAHLLVAFAPFIRSNQLNGFWQYNKHLFIRFLTSVLFSGVIYLGVSFALLSLDLLFDVDLHEQLFLDLWIFCAGFLNTWFFLSGIPEDYDELDKIEKYPFALKVFSQYILLPILGLYLFILYGYGAKIVLSWDWPKGIVSWLIIVVSVLGIFTFLLIHPYGKKEENAWIAKFNKIYYFVLLPLVAMLFFAITMRIADYGITLNRYIIVLLGVWLVVVCSYFIAGKTNIKFIPVSLCVMILLMSFGPWSMFSVSESSQVGRLEVILEGAGIVKDGKVVNEQELVLDSNFYNQNLTYPNQELLNDSLAGEVKSIIDYLDDHHGFSAMQDWFEQDFTDDIDEYNLGKRRWGRIDEGELFMKAMGLEYKYYYSYNENEYYSFNTKYSNTVTQVSGYDYMLNINNYYYNVNDDYNREQEYVVDSVNYVFKEAGENPYHVGLFEGDKVLLEMNVNTLMENMIEAHGKNYKSDLPKSELTLSGDNERCAYKLEVSNLSCRTTDGESRITSFNGRLFIKFKE